MSDKKVKLSEFNFRAVGDGFVVQAVFGDKFEEKIVEEKVAHNVVKLKKLVKFYLDELHEDVKSERPVRA